MLRQLVKILNPCLDPCRRIKQWWIKLPQWSTSNSIASSRGLEFLDKPISLGKPIQVNLHQLSIIPSKFLHTIKLNLNSSFWDKFFVQALYFHESLVISFRNWPNCSRKSLSLNLETSYIVDSFILLFWCHALQIGEIESLFIIFS